MNRTEIHWMNGANSLPEQMVFIEALPGVGNVGKIIVDALIEEHESEDKNPEDNNLSIDEKEEFSAEETESSEMDDEFNQETEEELLDIPTFLRRQAN